MTRGFQVSEELVDVRLDQCVVPENARFEFP